MKSKSRFFGKAIMLSICAILILFVLGSDLHDQTPILWGFIIILVINIWIFVRERREKK